MARALPVITHPKKCALRQGRLAEPLSSSIWSIKIKHLESAKQTSSHQHQHWACWSKWIIFLVPHLPNTFPFIIWWKTSYFGNDNDKTHFPYLGEQAMVEVSLARLKQHDSNNEHHSQPDTIKQLNVSEQANIEIRLTCRAGLDIHTRVTLSGSNVWFFLTSLSPSQSQVLLRHN